MSEYEGQDNGALRVTIREAAHRLGVTEAAIRKRIQRGSLHKELGSDGRVYVYLDLSQDMSYPESQVDRDPLVEELRDRIRSLERRLDEEGESRRRADTIIAQLTQANAFLARRVPELEAPQESREAPQTPAEAPGGVGGREDEGGAGDGSQRRSWWRTWFGF